MELVPADPLASNPVCDVIKLSAGSTATAKHDRVAEMNKHQMTSHIFRLIIFKDNSTKRFTDLGKLNFLMVV